MAQGKRQDRAEPKGLLEGKVAVVTGGANGIGAATVRAFRAQGARVFFCDVDARAGKALAKELGDGAFFSRLDLRREGEICRWIEQIGTPQEVFERPGNAFVMDFLGNVNVFAGRVQNGRALLGDVEIECPDYPHDEAQSARLYVRPHELEIDHAPNGESSLLAVVERMNGAGSVAPRQMSRFR